MTNEEASVNLLEYVATFKQHLMQACELARQNLQRTQSQKKVWYDKRSREQTFKAGDKVSVLLPLPDHPLQARYHGLYLVECKVGTVDYVVIIPDCRKGQQLCHITMLKEYYNENGGNVESCAVAVTSNHKEAKVESDCLSDTGAKLNNSAVLASLKNKLIHLSANEVSELEHLIMDNTQWRI